MVGDLKRSVGFLRQRQTVFVWGLMALFGMLAAPTGAEAQTVRETLRLVNSYLADTCKATPRYGISGVQDRKSFNQYRFSLSGETLSFKVREREASTYKSGVHVTKIRSAKYSFPMAAMQFAQPFSDDRGSRYYIDPFVGKFAETYFGCSIVYLYCAYGETTCVTQDIYKVRGSGRRHERTGETLQPLAVVYVRDREYGERLLKALKHLSTLVQPARAKRSADPFATP